MAFEFSYALDPRILGAYANLAGAAPAVRENVQTSIDNSMRAAQVSGQFTQNNRDREAATFDRQQDRLANLQARQMQLDADAMQAQGDLLERQMAADAAVEVEQLRQDGRSRQSFNERIQQGLKDGTLRYSPQSKQLYSELQQRIMAIDADPSIADDQKEQMVKLLQGRMERIIPQVVPESDRPTPIHQQAADTITVASSDGRVVPLGQLGRGLRDGDMIITGTVRNGSLAFNAKPYAAKKVEADQYADFENPVKLNRIRAEIARDIQADLDVEQDNALADWQSRKDAHEQSSAEPFTERRPVKRRPTPTEIDARLFELSGGVAGKSREQVGREYLESTAAPAIRQFISGVMPQGQQAVAANVAPGSQVQPRGQLRPYGNGTMIDEAGNVFAPQQTAPPRVASIAEAMQLPPGTQFIDPSGVLRIVPGDSAAGQSPVVVHSEAEALRLPVGTVFSLNGRLGQVAP